MTARNELMPMLVTATDDSCYFGIVTPLSVTTFTSLVWVIPAGALSRVSSDEPLGV